MGGSEDAYIAKRSPRVGTYPEALHVVPTGMSNARDLRWRFIDNEPPDPDFVVVTMLTELLEEEFDLEEFAYANIDHWRDQVNAQLARIGVIARPKFTRVAFDLLNLRPEVGALIHLEHSLQKRRGGLSR
jgi:hypothetical protein